MGRPEKRPPTNWIKRDHPIAAFCSSRGLAFSVGETGYDRIARLSIVAVERTPTPRQSCIHVNSPRHGVGCFDLADHMLAAAAANRLSPSR